MQKEGGKGTFIQGALFLLEYKVEAEHACLWSVGGGIVGGEQVDEEFKFAQSNAGKAEADGGTDVEAVEDVHPFVVGVPVVVGTETLGNEMRFEVHGGRKGGIEAEQVAAGNFVEFEIHGDRQADRPPVEALARRSGTVAGVEHQAAAVDLHHIVELCPSGAQIEAEMPGQVLVDWHGVGEEQIMEKDGPVGVVGRAKAVAFNP